MGVFSNHVVHACMNSYLLYSYKTKVLKHTEGYVHSYQTNHDINMEEGHIRSQTMSFHDILDRFSQSLGTIW